MSLVSWKSCAALAALLLISAGTATAQVCGDADSSGSVTVTDGVQALRAAAGLSTSCTGNTCDVDGSGSVTVTDGVNVLRKAAGIAITENCGSGDVGAQVKSLLQSSLPIFGNLTKLGSGANAAGTSQACDNPEGTVTIDQETGEISFGNCDLDGFNYNGFFAVSDTTLDFGITFTDLSTGESESLDGSLTQEVVGETFVSTGFFDLTSSLGTFSVDFDELAADPRTGNFIGGALEFSVDDGTLTEVDSIRLSFDTTNIALVEVNLVDGDVLPFNYNLVTEELTPAPN
jgi:hypothetical protein